MKRKVKFYSDEFKYKVVQEYLNSDLSIKELREKYSIGGPNSISNWMLKFGLREKSGIIRPKQATSYNVQGKSENQ